MTSSVSVGAVSNLLPAAETLTRDSTLLSDFGVAPRYLGWEPVSGVIELDEALAAAGRMLEWAQLAPTSLPTSGRRW